MPAGKSAGKNMSARSVASLSGTTEATVSVQRRDLIGARPSTGRSESHHAARACAQPLRSSGERSCEERGQDAADQEVFHRVVDQLVPGLHPFAGKPPIIDIAEDAVDPADPLAFF